MHEALSIMKSRAWRIAALSAFLQVQQQRPNINGISASSLWQASKRARAGITFLSSALPFAFMTASVLVLVLVRTRPDCNQSRSGSPQLHPRRFQRRPCVWPWRWWRWRVRFRLKTDASSALMKTRVMDYN